MTPSPVRRKYHEDEKEVEGAKSSGTKEDVSKTETNEVWNEWRILIENSPVSPMCSPPWNGHTVDCSSLPANGDKVRRFDGSARGEEMNSRRQKTHLNEPLEPSEKREVNGRKKVTYAEHKSMKSSSFHIAPCISTRHRHLVDLLKQYTVAFNNNHHSSRYVQLSIEFQPYPSRFSHSPLIHLNISPQLQTHHTYNGFPTPNKSLQCVRGLMMTATEVGRKHR